MFVSLFWLKSELLHCILHGCTTYSLWGEPHVACGEPDATNFGTKVAFVYCFEYKCKKLWLY